MAGISVAHAERDLATYLTSFVQEMAFSEEDPQVVLDRYHTPDIQWCTDGLRLDRERLVAHARPARRNATSCAVEVHEAVAAGDRFAVRYTLRATMRKGGGTVTDIHMFGRLAPDGRIRRVDQLTRTVAAAD